MPIIASAIKKLRKDRKRTITNAVKTTHLAMLLKKAHKTKKADAAKAAISAIDKAVKTHLVNKNKASRLKSKLSKLVAKPSSISPSKSTKRTSLQKTKIIKSTKQKKNVS